MLPISPRGMWSWQQRGNDSDRPPTPRIVRSFSVQREDASRAAFRGSLPGQQGEEDKLCTVTLDHTPAECSQPWSSAAGKARGASIQADAAASLSENAYKPALYSDRPEAAQRPPAAPRTPPLSQRHATPLDITDALPTPRPCATPPPVAPLGIGLVGVSAPLHRSCPSKPRLLGASALAAPCSPAADPVEPARRRVRTRRALFPPPSGLASPPTTLPDARGDRREAKGWVGAAPPPGEAWSSPKATRSPHCSLSSMSTASAPVSEVRDEGGLGDGPPAPGESTAEDGGEEGRSGGEEASREGGSVAIGRGRSAGAAAGSGKKRRGGRGRGKDGRYKGRRGKGETGGGGDEGGDEGKRKGVRVRGKEKDKERARRRKSAKGRAIGVIDEDALETVCGSASGGSRGGEGHERRGAAEVVEEAGGGGAAGVSGEVLAVQLLETKRVVAAVRGARRQEEEREEKRGAGVDVEMARKQAKERLQVGWRCCGTYITYLCGVRLQDRGRRHLTPEGAAISGSNPCQHPAPCRGEGSGKWQGKRPRRKSNRLSKRSVSWRTCRQTGQQRRRGGG